MPVIADLFCGAGGAGMGYFLAGFEVVGVDLAPQPHYPFDFVQANALTVDLAGFDAVHASPPCQRFSVTKSSHDFDNQDLLSPMLERLAPLRVPWVVENVIGAPVPNPLLLCGASFNLVADDADGAPLVLRRHRLFGSSHLLMGLPCACRYYRRRGHRVAGVYGGGPIDRARSSGTPRGGYTPSGVVRGALLGIDWMTTREISDAIPPAYTEHIGRQLLDHLS